MDDLPQVARGVKGMGVKTLGGLTCQPGQAGVNPGDINGNIRVL
jgi:hypothetical protein